MNNDNLQKKKTAIGEKIAKYDAELQSITVTWRHGETRRFHSNANKINRRNWIVGKLAELKAKLNNLN